jgi:hypothetical protein
MLTIIIGIVIVYAAFHLGAGHTHYRYRKARGIAPNFYWSSVRGPYASVRLTGRLPHRAQAVTLQRAPAGGAIYLACEPAARLTRQPLTPSKGLDEPMSQTTTNAATLSAHDDSQRALLTAVLHDAIEWHYEQANECADCRTAGTICGGHTAEHDEPIGNYLSILRRLGECEGMLAGDGPELGADELRSLTAALHAAIAYRQTRMANLGAALLAAYAEIDHLASAASGYVRAAPRL